MNDFNYFVVIGLFALVLVPPIVWFIISLKKKLTDKNKNSNN